MSFLPKSSGLHTAVRAECCWKDNERRARREGFASSIAGTLSVLHLCFASSLETEGMNKVKYNSLFLAKPTLSFNTDSHQENYVAFPIQQEEGKRREVETCSIRETVILQPSGSRKEPVKWAPKYDLWRPAG